MPVRVLPLPRRRSILWHEHDRCGALFKFHCFFTAAGGFDLFGDGLQTGSHFFLVFAETLFEGRDDFCQIFVGLILTGIFQGGNG